MRDPGLGLVLALLAIAVVGGAGLLWLQPSGFMGQLLGVNTASQPAAVTSAPAASEAPKPLLKTTRRHRPTSELTLADASLPPAVANLLNSAAPRPPVPVFPTAREVRAGTAGTLLAARFGQPDLRASTIEAGAMIERCVYLDHDRRLVTVVTLMNGKVSSAETLVQR